jgi:hypothetical protein
MAKRKRKSEVPSQANPTRPFGLPQVNTHIIPVFLPPLDVGFNAEKTLQTASTRQSVL